MVTYAQQTDPEKARISSIDTTKVVDAPVVDTVKATPYQDRVSPDGRVITDPTKFVSEQDKRRAEYVKEGRTKVEQAMDGGLSERKVRGTEQVQQTGEQTQQTGEQQAPTGSYYKDVYLPKVQAERARRAAMSNVAEVETPAPSKTEIMDTKTIAQQYDSGAISAIDLENLRQTDPLKYQEAKAEIERKRVIDAINQNQEDFLNTYKSMFDSYVSKWEELTSSDEGKNLRSEIFAKYGLDESNEKIKNYTTQIDDVEEQLDNLVNYEGTGSALGDRGELIRKQRDLTKQRMDLVKTRAAELDYYRLGLEQADAVVSDYKEYQKQELDMMGKKFEMMTGMSTMEFEMKDKQARDYLVEVDNNIADIEAQIVQRAKTESDRFYTGSLLSLYDEFTPEAKAYLSQLEPAQLEKVLENYADKTKLQQDAMYKERDYELKEREFGFKQKQAQIDLEFKKAELNMKNTEIIKMDDGSLVAFNKSTGAVEPVFMPTTQSPIHLKETDLQSIINNCVTKRGKTNIQCGELVNDYRAQQTGNRMGVKDSYESKVKAIQAAGQSPVPVPGGVFAFPGGEYGHTGIITKVFDDGSVEVLEANRGGGGGSYPEVATYSASKVKSMVFSYAPPAKEEYEVNFDEITLPPKATEGQRKALSFANRMRDSHEKLLTLGLEDTYAERTGIGQQWQERAPNIAKSGAQKDLNMLKQAFISGVLRAESGAAITDTEFDRYETMYFPQPGDTKDTISKKQAMREEAIKSMYGQVGTDASRVPVSQYYDPTILKDRLNTLNTPKTVYTDPVDEEFNQYFGVGADLVNTIPGF